MRSCKTCAYFDSKSRWLKALENRKGFGLCTAVMPSGGGIPFPVVSKRDICPGYERRARRDEEML